MKSNSRLTKEMMELQNQLTWACHDCDLEKVKELIEKKGADPAIPDEKGNNPMFAAICAWSFPVIDYLENNVRYTKTDWIKMVTDGVQLGYFSAPCLNSILTYGQWLNHYNSGKDKWFYNEGEIKRRAPMHDDEFGRPPRMYDEGGFVCQMEKMGGQVSLIGSGLCHDVWPDKPALYYQIWWAKKAWETMAKRFKARSVDISILYKDTPKDKNVSRMRVNNILSRKKKGPYPWYATWERIIFSQNYKAELISAVQLKLDTDLVLDGALFDDLLDIIKNPIPPSSNKFECDPMKYEPLSFKNILTDIRPGKHYLKYKEYQERKEKNHQQYESYNTIKEVFTGTGSFIDSSIVDHINVLLLQIERKKNYKFKYHPREGVGLNYREKTENFDKKTNKTVCNPQYINLEIKFDDPREVVIFRARSKKQGVNEEERFPKKRIILNIHMYSKNDIEIHNKEKIISNENEFKKQIIERLTEFSESFIFCSEWFNTNLDSLVEILKGKQPPVVDVCAGDPPVFYSCLKDPKKKQGYKLLLMQNFPRNGIKDDLEIYIERSRDNKGKLNFTMLDPSGKQRKGTFATPHITIPPELTETFLNENKDSILAYMAKEGSRKKGYIRKQQFPPYRSPEIPPLDSSYRSLGSSMAAPLPVAALQTLSIKHNIGGNPPPSSYSSMHPFSNSRYGVYQPAVSINQDNRNKGKERTGVMIEMKKRSNQQQESYADRIVNCRKGSALDRVVNYHKGSDLDRIVHSHGRDFSSDEDSQQDFEQEDNIGGNPPPSSYSSMQPFSHSRYGVYQPAASINQDNRNKRKERTGVMIEMKKRSNQQQESYADRIVNYRKGSALDRVVNYHKGSDLDRIVHSQGRDFSSVEDSQQDFEQNKCKLSLQIKQSSEEFEEERRAHQMRRQESDAMLRQQIIDEKHISLAKDENTVKTELKVVSPQTSSKEAPIPEDAYGFYGFWQRHRSVLIGASQVAVVAVFMALASQIFQEEDVESKSIEVRPGFR